MSLRVEHLSKDYPTRSGPLTVLRDVSLTLERGQALAVMGPSGSGKSTLLHILGTLDHPSAGTVWLGDIDPFRLPERQLADFRNKNIGFIFQDHYLLPQCSVLENVLIPTLAGNRGQRSEVNDQRSEVRGQESEPAVPARDRDQGSFLTSEQWARKLLERVGLAQRLEHRPAELSGGERQRVAVARALVRKPTLLLADEPTGNLDRKTAQEVGRLLLELHQQEQTILIVVTHSAELARLFPAQQEMADGRLQPVEVA
jgi:lipoprotein-releasing system ATP-binding protein